jgi:hypothetical protein
MTLHCVTAVRANAGRPGDCGCADRAPRYPTGLTDGQRALPADFPPWPTVYGLHARWKKDGVLADITDLLRAAVRKAAGPIPSRRRRSWTPRACASPPWEPSPAAGPNAAGCKRRAGPAIVMLPSPSCGGRRGTKRCPARGRAARSLRAGG